MRLPALGGKLFGAMSLGISRVGELTDPRHLRPLSVGRSLRGEPCRRHMRVSQHRGVLFVVVLVTRALLFRVYTWAP